MKFSSITLLRKDLQSRITRLNIGERFYDANAALDSASSNNDGIIKKIFNLGGKLINFLVSAAIQSLAFIWSIVDLWDIIVDAYFEIKYFDWNQTDAEIRNQISQSNQLIATSLGGLTATGLVWLSGIGISGALTTKFPVIAGRMALALAEEGSSEIKGALVELFTTIRQAVVRNFILGSLLTFRKLKLFGLMPVTEEKRSWTIAEAIEEKVESIKSPILRSFTEGFLDRLEEGIIEMGYVVAMTLDDHYALQKHVQQDEPERTLIVQPNKDTEDEKLVILGTQSQVVETLQSTLATHTLVHNRDVGQIVGSHYDDWYKTKPYRRAMKLVFHDKQTPPWKQTNGDNCLSVEINIPDVLPGVTWEKIKLACESYTWGPVLVQQDLDNGRQISVYATTYTEGKRVITRMLNLTSAKPYKPMRQSMVDDDLIPAELKKKPKLVYPAYGTLLIRDATDNNVSTYKKNKEAANRFELWTTTEPDNFKNIAP